jgi:hypothetical protein
MSRIRPKRRSPSLLRRSRRIGGINSANRSHDIILPIFRDNYGCWLNFLFGLMRTTGLFLALALATALMMPAAAFFTEFGTLRNGVNCNTPVGCKVQPVTCYCFQYLLPVLCSSAIFLSDTLHSPPLEQSHVLSSNLGFLPALTRVGRCETGGGSDCFWSSSF